MLRPWKSYSVHLFGWLNQCPLTGKLEILNFYFSFCFRWMAFWIAIFKCSHFRSRLSFTDDVWHWFRSSLNIWRHKSFDAHGLKALVDTFGNCQRAVFSLGVSQHMHKITRVWKFELNRSSSLRENNERKKPCHTKLCAF